MFACATYQGASPFLTNVSPKVSTELNSNSDKKVAIKNKESFIFYCGVFGNRELPIDPNEIGTSFCRLMTDFNTIKTDFNPYHYQSNNGFDGFHNLTFTTTNPVSTHVTFSVSHTQHAKYAYKADVKLKPDNFLDLWINNRHVEEVSGGPVYSSTCEANNIYYFTSDNAYNDVYKISVYDDLHFIDGSLTMEVTLFYK